MMGKRQSIGKWKAFQRKALRQKYLMVMVLPGLVWYILFKYLPMLGLGLAFTDYGFKAKVSFIGFENFHRLLTSAVFWKAFRNTLVISMLNILFYFPMPLIIALLINELKSFRAKKTIQFLIYIPYFFSWVVVGSIFVNLLSPNLGAGECLSWVVWGRADLFHGERKTLPLRDRHQLHLAADGLWGCHLHCGTHYHRAAAV